MPSGRITQHLPTRFESKYIPEPNSGCWLWLGTNVRSGDPSSHGQFWVGTRKSGTMKLAHRVSYELYVGPIPEGMNVNHQCDTPACVNPDHLRVGTQAENVHEAIERGIFRQKPKATHYRCGHPWTDENSYKRTDGSRRCRTCTRSQQARIAS